MGSVMRIDVVSIKFLIILSVVSVVTLLLAIIIGATGPSVYDISNTYAYNCPEGSHIWSPQCSGVELKQNGTAWEWTLPKMKTVNRFWALEVYPYSTSPQEISGTITFAASLFAKVGTADNFEWLSLQRNDSKQQVLNCRANGVCDGFLLVWEEFINYEEYRILIWVDHSQGTPAPATYLGDVQLQLTVGHPGFAALEISLKTLSLVFNIVVLVVHLWHLRGTAFSDWSWEQRAITLLLIVLALYNNFFTAIEYGVKGWFFPFLSSLCEVVFFSVLMLFWLLMVDKIRRDELRIEMGLYHLPKVIVTILFGILTLVLFSWISIRDEQDPIYGVGITGIQVLFYIVVFIWTGVLVWVGILVAMTVPIISRKPYLKTRFLFFGIPTGIVIISVLIGIFTGTFGPVRKSTLSFTYFQFLLNLYVYVLLWGYWPIQEGISGTNPSEDSRLTFQSNRDFP